MLEWTAPEVPAQVTVDPTTFVDGHGQFNTAPALLIHSGDGDGVCVEGSVLDLVRWIDAARTALLEAFAADVPMVSDGRCDAAHGVGRGLVRCARPEGHPADFHVADDEKVWEVRA